LKLKSKLKNIIEAVYNLPFIEKPLLQNPFGKKIWATKDKYLDLYYEAISLNDDLVKAFEKKYGFAINYEYWKELALHTQVVIKNESLNFFHGRILYSVLSKYLKDFRENDSISIFETGTARGFSSICMAKALIDMKANGFITTIDSIPHEKKIYWNCIDDNEGPKKRSELLVNWSNELERIIFLQGWTTTIISRVGLSRINFAFLDAQHTKENVLKEFMYVFERQKEGDIIVFDDVTKSLFPGVCDAVEIIEKNYPYQIEKINFSESRGYAIGKRFS